MEPIDKIIKDLLAQGKSKEEVSEYIQNTYSPDDIKAFVGKTAQEVFDPGGYEKEWKTFSPEERIDKLKKDYEGLGYTVSESDVSPNHINVSNNKGEDRSFLIKEESSKPSPSGNFSIPGQDIDELNTIKEFINNNPTSPIYKEIYNATKQLPDDYARLGMKSYLSKTLGPIENRQDDPWTATPEEQLELIDVTRGLITDFYKNPSIFGMSHEESTAQAGFDNWTEDQNEEIQEKTYEALKEETGLNVNWRDFLSIYDNIKPVTIETARRQVAVEKNTLSLTNAINPLFKQETQDVRFNRLSAKEQNKVKLNTQIRGVLEDIEQLKTKINVSESGEQQDSLLNQYNNKQGELVELKEQLKKNAVTKISFSTGVPGLTTTVGVEDESLKTSFFDDQGWSQAAIERYKKAQQNAKEAAPAEINQIKSINRGLTEYEAAGVGYDNAVKRLQLLQRNASEQLVKINTQKLVGNNDDIRRILFKNGYLPSMRRDDQGEIEISLRQLKSLGIDSNRFEGFWRSAGPKESISEKDVVAMKMYEEEYTEINASLDAFYNLYYRELDPASIEKVGFLKNILQEGIVASGEALGMNRETAENFATLGQGERARVSLDLLDAAAAEYNELGLGDEPLEFTEEQAAAIERTFSEQVSEGVGQFVPIMVELGVLNAATGGALTYTGAARLLTKLNKSKNIWDKMLYHGALGMLEEAKLQTVGFKPGGGVAFYGLGQATKGIRLPVVRSLDPFFQKIIKAGPVGAVSLEVAGVSELAYDALMANKDFKAGFDELYSDLDDVSKRMIVNSFVFSIAGAGHLKGGDFKSTGEKIKTRDRIIEEINTLSDEAVSSAKGPEGKQTLSIDTKKQRKIEGLLKTVEKLNQQIAYEANLAKLDPKSKNFQTQFEETFVRPMNKTLEAVVPGYKGFTVITPQSTGLSPEVFRKKYFKQKGKVGGEFSPEKNEVYLDTSNPEFIKTYLHEATHAALKSYFQENPGQKFIFNERLQEIFKETIIPVEGTTKKVTGKELGEAVEGVYSKYEKNAEKLQEEFLVNLIEQLSNPEFYYTEVAPTIIKEVKQELKNFFVENGLYNARLPETATDFVNAISNIGYNTRRGKHLIRSSEILGRLNEINLNGIELMSVGKGKDVKSKPSRDIKEFITDKEIQKLYTERKPDWEVDVIKSVPVQSILNKLVDKYKNRPSKTGKVLDSEGLKDLKQDFELGVLELLGEYSKYEKKQIADGKEVAPLLGFINQSFAPGGRFKKYINIAEKNLGQEFSVDLEAAKGIVEAEVTPVEQKTKKAQIDLSKKIDKKEKELIEQNLDKYLKEKDLSIEDLYIGNLPDLAPNITEKLFGVGEGALRTEKGEYRNLKGKENIQIQTALTSDPSFYRKLLPPLNIVPSQAKGTKQGRAIGIPQVLLKSFYESTGKRSKGKTSQTDIKKLKPEFIGSDKSADNLFLEVFGKVKGQPAEINRTIDTKLQAMARFTGKMLSNKVIRDKLFEENKNILEDIAAGKSETMAKRELFLGVDKKEIKNIKAASLLLSKGKYDEAFEKFPQQSFELENLFIESKINEVLELQQSQPTFKTEASKLKDIVYKEEKIFSSEIRDGVVGSGMRKVQKKDGKRISETYDIGRITKQIETMSDFAKTLPIELKSYLTKETLLQSLGSGTYATGRDIKKTGKIPKTDPQTGTEISKFDIIKNQSSKLLDSWGTGKKTKAFEGLLDIGVIGIGRQKTAFEKALKEKDSKKQREILEKVINEADNQQKAKLYNAFQTALQEWLYNSKNKKEFIDRAQAIMQSAADNSSLIMGFGRQFVPIKAVLIKPNSTLETLKIEHAKTSLKQSLDAARAVVEGRWIKEGEKISKDYVGILSYAEYLKRIDKLGGTTNLAGINRMVLDFENLKNYATVDSGFKKTLYQEILQEAAKEFNSDIKILGEKYLLDQLAYYGITKSPTSKVLLKTALENKKLYKDVLNNNKKLALDAKVKNINDLSNYQILDKLKEKDKIATNKVNESFAARDLSAEFNKILENKTGIGADKVYSDVKARVVGAGKGKLDFFVPPSAEDFVGLLYKTLGKGKVGDAQMAWYKKNLLDPFSGAMDNLSRDRIALMNDFKALKKELKIVPKNLKKKLPGEPFTQEQAIRTYIWNKQNMLPEGMSKADLKELTKFVETNPELKAFADQLILINKGNKYAGPKTGWLSGNITTDLIDGINTIKRSKYLETWQRNVDNIFSKNNLNKLEAIYGKNYRTALEGILKRMRTGRNREFNSDSLTGRVTDWLTNSIGAVMFFNTRSAVLQTISAVNFINFKENNIFAAGKAFANQPQFWKDFKTLFNSDFLVDRRNGLKLNVNEADIANMAKKGGVRGVISEMLRLGFLPTQIADSFAIASGGATFYRNKIKSLEKSGLTKTQAEKQAFREFREVAEESQQSSRPDRISQQQAGPLGRIILAFANTPMQYTRLMKKAALDLKNGRGHSLTNISKIFYYGFAQNLIFNAMQQALFAIGFGDEEEETEKREKKYTSIANSMADSILRGTGVGGAIFSVLKNTGIRLTQEAQKKSPKFQDVLTKEIAQLSPPISSKLSKLKAAGKSYSWNKKEMMEKGFSLDNPAYLAAGQVIAATTNIPLDRAFKKIDNIRKASSSDYEAWARIAMLAGWSDWEIGVKKSKSEQKKKKKKVVY